MKKFILALGSAAFIFIGTANAQSYPDFGFETWTPDPGNAGARDPNSGSAPNQWQCLNSFSNAILGNSPVSVFQDSTIVHSGKYACKIKSVVLTTGPSGSYHYISPYFPHDTLGIVITGTFQSAPTPALKIGIPYKWRLTSFNFYYQYFPTVNVKPDTAFCSIALSHFNGSISHTLGAGTVKLNSASTWTLGTVTMAYDSATGLGDTLTIMFSSSSFYKPLPGSILYLDDASITGLNDLNAPAAHVDVYPNPASTQVNFSISSVKGEEGYSIAVYDITGKKINTYPVKNNLASINTGTYNSGLYFYQLYDKSGNQMKIGKFSIEK